MICKKCKQECEKTSNVQKYCRKCSKKNKKEYMKKYRKENKEKIQMDFKRWCENNKECMKNHRRKWGKENKEEKQQYQIKWKKSEKGRKSSIESDKKYKKLNPEKYRARKQAIYYIKIPKGQMCILCYMREATERHHPNYDYPLEVWFLCMWCHKELHVEV